MVVSLAHRVRWSACLFAALLASAIQSGWLGAQEPSFRSAAEPRRWLADERQQPRHAERETHRGFEIATGPIIVVATTSQEDARLAAEQAMQAWNEVAGLADHWTSVHRQPNFAQGAVQIVINDEPQQQRDEPLAAISLVGQATQISIHVAADQPPLADQRGQLRQATAMAFLHTAELDRQMPDWVCQGLAAYAGGLSTGSSGPAAATDDSQDSAPPGGNQWRPERAAPDRLEKQTADRTDAARLVRFLIEGNDAQHAGTFFEHLRSLAALRPDEDGDFRRKLHQTATDSNRDAGLDEFVAALAGEYEMWKRDPQIGQPEHAAEENADEGMRQRQEEMLFVLKLTDRFAFAQSAVMRTRITTFGKERGATVLASTSSARPPSVQSLVERITSESQPEWATVGPDRKLIWSTEEDKLRELLGIEGNRYQHVWESDRWVLRTKLDDGRQLAGWLEANPKNVRRPLAKFAVKSPD